MNYRERVVAFVDEGHMHRAAARHYWRSPRFVNDMIKLRCKTTAVLVLSWESSSILYSGKEEAVEEEVLYQQ
ncbi:MAG: hypothetical protein P8Y67_14695, partial [Alphaproteobacteria bacterium]